MSSKNKKENYKDLTERMLKLLSNKPYNTIKNKVNKLGNEIKNIPLEDIVDKN